MRPVAADTSPLYQQSCNSWRKEPSSYWVSRMAEALLKTEAPSTQSTRGSKSRANCLCQTWGSRLIHNMCRRGKKELEMHQEDEYQDKKLVCMLSMQPGES